MKSPIPPLNCECKGIYMKSLYHYSEPPPKEIRFAVSSENIYKRDLLKCTLCGHYSSIHDLNLESMYTNNYVSSNYQDDDGIRKTFERIIALPPEKSDNLGRVQFVQKFAENYFRTENFQNKKILDIGSGLCVFLYRMKGYGWDCTALDPDVRAANHAKINVGIKSVVGDFMIISHMEKYDLITLNKVLEHVEYPVEMLAKTKSYLNNNGIVYIELPDGEMAETEGKDREEFTIDHPHNFSIISAAKLIAKAGFTVLKMERLKEPSTKYTIRAFIRSGE